MILATATGVTKRFGGFTAVACVDLSVESGEVVGLLGANGAGKTTLIRALLGLTIPTEGSVELFGRPPSRATRRRIGYVPQGLGLYDDLTAGENLAFAAAAFGVPARAAEDLTATAETLVRDLPLGLKRRVAFAAALQHSPDLLVLDEPTSGVDVLGRARLWDTIRSAAEGGAGVIVTTHHMDEAEECDRLVMMASGRVVAQGSLDDIVGGRHTVVVRAASWPEAFDSLERAGFNAALVGGTLRLAGADVDRVGRTLRSAGLHATVESAPATLEETFVRLAAEAA